MEEDTSEFELFKFSPRSDIRAGSDLLISISNTEHFRNLSVHVARVIPNLLLSCESSITNSKEGYAKEIHAIFSDTVIINDASNLLSFIKKYSSVITSAVKASSSFSQYEVNVAEYICHDFPHDVSYATHLDVTDIVLALKKGVLSKLVGVAQLMLTPEVQEDEFTKFLKVHFTKYEWVKNLTSIQLV